MPDKKYGFTYRRNGFSQTEYNIYNYYIRLVERYQDDRREAIWNTGTFDDQQLIKQHYLTEKVGYLSHIEPLKDTGLLFANRTCGYLAFSNKIPKNTLDPLRELGFKKVGSFFEYLAVVKNTEQAGFFYIGSQLCCYATVTSEDVKVVTAKGNISLLLFCESFIYTESTTKTGGVIGKAIISSPYFKDITVNIYTSASLGYLDKYYIYALTSSSDTHPVGKVPGEPMFKTLVMNGFDSSIEKIKIDNTTITLSSQLNKVITVDDNRFFSRYLALKYIGSGKIEVGFTFPYKEDPQLDSISFDVQYYQNGVWSSTQKCQVLFSDNQVSSLQNLLTVDTKDYYLDTPTMFTLRVQNRYFFEHPTTQSTVILTYSGTTRNVNIRYQQLTSNQYVYSTDYITLSSVEGHTPSEFVFNMNDKYDKVNGFNIPVWVYGYTVGDILKIPNGSIIVKQNMTSTFAYTEYSKTNYTIEFEYTGAVDLETVEIRNVFDKYSYFTTEDFTLTLASKASGKLTYTLTLDKKIITYPIANLTQIPININFIYHVSDGTDWHSDTFTKTLTLTYVKDRWALSNVAIDNKGLGEASLSFKMRDKLLNQYTGAYMTDQRLSPSGKPVLSNNVKATTNELEWDFNNKQWVAPVNILSYGDITVQFKGVNAQSDTVTLKHDKPTHPLTITPSSQTAYVGVQTRVMFGLKYNDTIKSIYANGKLIGTQVPDTFKGVRDNVVYLTAIQSADRKQITAIAGDLVPDVEGVLTYPIKITGVNDFDYSTWPAESAVTITVKPQGDKVNFTFTLGDDFAFGKDSTGVLDLHDNILSDAKIVAEIINPKTQEVVARPNFNPVTNAKFDTINLFLDSSLSSQKEYILDIEVYEYENAKKDNNLPQYLYYQTQITFKVP